MPNRQFEDLERGPSEASDRMKSMMPPRAEAMSDQNDFGVEEQSLTPEEIESKVDGFKPVDSKKHRDVVQRAEKEVGRKPNNGQVVDVEGEDGYYYKVVYDAKKGFLVFRGDKFEDPGMADVQEVLGTKPKLVTGKEAAQVRAQFSDSELKSGNVLTISKGATLYAVYKGKVYKN